MPNGSAESDAVLPWYYVEIAGPSPLTRYILRRNIAKIMKDSRLLLSNFKYDMRLQ